jgi:hypothetical protein
MMTQIRCTPSLLDEEREGVSSLLNVSVSDIYQRLSSQASKFDDKHEVRAHRLPRSVASFAASELSSPVRKRQRRLRKGRTQQSSWLIVFWLDV